MPLDEVDHDLLSKCADVLAKGEGDREPVLSIDHCRLLKVKTGQWRGALLTHSAWAAGWVLSAVRPEVRAVLVDSAWLLSGGLRRDGDPVDFYERLARDARARAARRRQQGETAFKHQTDISVLLPAQDDVDRLSLEVEFAAADLYRSSMLELLTLAVRAPSGGEAVGELAGNRVSVTVERTSISGVYVTMAVAERTDSGFTDRVIAGMYEVLPALSIEGWDLMMGLPNRPAEPDETALLQYVVNEELVRFQ